MQAPRLTGKQARRLRALGHALRPAVLVGKGGLGDAVVAEIDRALAARELVKVRLQEGCGLDRRTAARVLGERLGAAVAQVLGRTILLYRPGPGRRIPLPD
ncbi:ribosome assembly RNA-binding protein YhbY [Dissulfurirhabdus thermomarina]|uniref:Ribosome assembly RNA-binding protein YhbY n=1 Tax=Dissulfurirhabdus thermomarina TaxID=1765737 RepID=A0A6N9TK78_DISTH|nr:ribosome assembly RNA-binding protein YhbY [Dissulfurirhabdus thermomarina]NDY41655.1 ribosome assembly RNA-binding protein YhbY [Dissulfurirhabdus thermomarina]NMX24347.1 ribosome assembly RNA-binding protein YhbY [Dissulfurirhabdus thermomarina]